MRIINKILNNKATFTEILNYLRTCNDDIFIMYEGWYDNELFNKCWKIDNRRRKINKLNNE